MQSKVGRKYYEIEALSLYNDSRGEYHTLADRHCIGRVRTS
jgi:hypothetical protein